MERHGWRAIIYDADWARFKTGQTGVIVSEDGRSCETVNDDKSSIIIEADPNVSLYSRENGHVLFRQKGSDLFDIVCLYQKAGGTYSLEVNDLTIDGCIGITYGEIINKLVIYEVFNNEKTQVTSYEGKQAMLVKPTASDVTNNNGFKNSTDSTISFPIEISNGGASASAKLYSTVSGNEYESYSYTTIDGMGSVTICKLSDGSMYCNIYADKGNKLGACTGGSVTFGVNEGHTSSPTYYIDFSNVKASETYNVMKCGDVIKTTTREVSLSYSVVPKSGVSVVETSSSGLKVSVASGISSINVIASTSRGESKEITLQIPSTLCTPST